MALVMGISDACGRARCRRAHRRRHARRGPPRPSGAQGLSRRRRDARAPARDAVERRARRGADRRQAHRRLWRRARARQGIASRCGPGEMVAMLGANGAGKSTTMRAISGLLRPVDGAIVLDNAPIDELEPTRSRGAAWRSCRRAGRCSPSSACSTTSCSARTAARTPTATTRSRRCSNAFRA